MSTEQIENLRAENWQNKLAYQRIEGLQALENQLAASENRKAARVYVFDGSTNRGQFNSEDNTIGINFSLVNDETKVSPYQATETLFHEARHAYQNHVINNPDTGEDPQTVTNWQMNNSPGVYTQYENDPELYGMQPIELDARQNSRQRTNALYEEQFGNSPEYQSYKSEKSAENQEWIDTAKATWNTQSPENVAVEKISEKYSQMMAEEQGEDASYGYGY